MAADARLAPFVTHGIKQNREKLFKIAFTGAEVYRLLQFLEHTAVENQDFLKVRECVFFAESIRNQAKEQGF